MRVWGDGTIKRLETFCRSVRATPEERADLLQRWRARYIAEREAYLATLPDLSRMGRQIWAHAIRTERRG